MTPSHVLFSQISERTRKLSSLSFFPDPGTDFPTEEPPGTVSEGPGRSSANAGASKSITKNSYAHAQEHSNRSYFRLFPAPRLLKDLSPAHVTQ